MSSLNKLKKITEDIKKLKIKIKTYENIRNEIIQEIFKNNSANFINFNLFKNSDEILITKNDIECENDQSDYEVKSENTDSENSDSEK